MSSARWGVPLLSALLLAGCGGAKSAAPVGVSAQPADAPVSYRFDSLDAREVSSDAARGKPTVIAFIATYDLMSQAQADFLSVMSRSDGDEINYYLIALDDRNNRSLVEAFARALNLHCPVAMGDSTVVAGASAFGEIAVPTVVVLDAQSRVVWRRVGLAKSDELRQVLGALTRASE